eukprot:884407-Rhodomonas_salina.3
MHGRTHFFESDFVGPCIALPQPLFPPMDLAVSLRYSGLLRNGRRVVVVRYKIPQNRIRKSALGLVPSHRSGSNTFYNRILRQYPGQRPRTMFHNSTGLGSKANCNKMVLQYQLRDKEVVLPCAESVPVPGQSSGSTIRCASTGRRVANTRADSRG